MKQKDVFLQKVEEEATVLTFLVVGEREEMKNDDDLHKNMAMAYNNNINNNKWNPTFQYINNRHKDFMNEIFILLLFKL